MARSAEETASILIGLYEESFAGDSFKPFRIGWPELRSLAGIARLTDEYLWEIDLELKESGYFLFPLDTFVLVAVESDLSYIRAIPPRIVEQYLPGDEDDFEIPGFDDEDDLDDSEFLDSLLAEDSATEAPATLGAKTATTAQKRAGRRDKGPDGPENISP
jgi:hypothetical protein